MDYIKIIEELNSEINSNIESIILLTNGKEYSILLTHLNNKNIKHHKFLWESDNDERDIDTVTNQREDLKTFLKRRYNEHKKQR